MKKKIIFIFIFAMMCLSSCNKTPETNSNISTNNSITCPDSNESTNNEESKEDKPSDTTNSETKTSTGKVWEDDEDWGPLHQ